MRRKLNFDCSAVDGQLRTEPDGPTIGLLLCRGRDRMVVEYSLRDIKKPLGVSEYTTLPRELQDKLPTIEQLEEELRWDETGSESIDELKSEGGEPE